jgi:hypothetical protein
VGATLQGTNRDVEKAGYAVTIGEAEPLDCFYKCSIFKALDTVSFESELEPLRPARCPTFAQFCIW